ncbi:MAG: transcriptional antiterminator, Rof [Thiogranum sp.]|jgi:transcriptional antiterminator Rof (Rho-off)|nr:transcriptional antiterminator, Rof [Thiogranum sp.]
MTDYTPIDCGQYSEYEPAILRQKRLRISWHDPNGQSHIDVFMPIDLFTRSGAEFLILDRGDGAPFELRLDRISKTEPL